ncbi:hypothetical protein F4821DRAFT_2812 [Hypoxylon rubiginosum]|uniref:Uncharacterized protein n=1 Tax=Hypoxylon rubiginosum TaxID=110542 RepID=A0ACC0DL72_9PEZI|nr:hypothetical protein F4821DRAFT_2812 [Hypoxylon rubiginosum]
MNDALAKAPNDVVRAILTALCSDEDINRRVNEYLRKIANKTHPQISKSSKGSGSNARKRKATEDIKICVQCQSPFYEDENDKKACKFHDGYLEVDYDNDFWADHDENCHGTIDTPEMREENPEGFEWDCCGKGGDTNGCKRGPHKATGAERGRYGDNSDGEGTEEDDSEGDD